MRVSNGRRAGPKKKYIGAKKTQLIPISHAKLF